MALERENDIKKKPKSPKTPQDHPRTLSWHPLEPPGPPCDPPGALGHSQFNNMFCYLLKSLQGAEFTKYPWLASKVMKRAPHLNEKADSAGM